MKLRYRTVWISDTHLGSRGCRAADLARFLKHLRCEKLYFVGDILDLSLLKQRWHFPAAHNQVVRRLLKHARRTQVIYIPGNHDGAARQYRNLEFGGIRLQTHAEHLTADGRRLLITHGDEFDLIVQHSPWLCNLGSWAYDWLIALNRAYNALRSALGLPYSSLAHAIKHRVKSACKFISRFEQTLVGEAQRRGFAGVVCGHIHQAQARADGVQYFNCGDWIENCTALVEHADGRMEIVDGLAAVAELQALKARRQQQRAALLPAAAAAVAPAPRLAGAA